MIKRCKIDWDTEDHTFEFHTEGQVITSLDFLGDLIQSLKKLRNKIADKPLSEEIPDVYKVRGNCINTWIKEKQ
tara:strand:- start:313 stop:534 length:222 start_codon:yes stop_codon:yes gene_type:complete